MGKLKKVLLLVVALCVMISIMSIAATATGDDPVARIGSTTYASLADAIAAAQDGDTVTMLADVTLSDTLEIKKSITLDLNENTLSKSLASASDKTPVIKALAGTVEIKNGAITYDISTYTSTGAQSNANVINVGMNMSNGDYYYGECDLTLNGVDVSVTFPKGKSLSMIYVESGKLNVIDSILSATNVSGNTSAQHLIYTTAHARAKVNPYVSISGSTTLDTNSSAGIHAIWLQGSNDTLIISGNDVTISADAMWKTASWSSTYSYAYAVNNQSGAACTIEGGKFLGKVWQTKGTIDVSGGYFGYAQGTSGQKNKITLAEGYEYLENTDSATMDDYPYVVAVPASYVAQIGATKYETLADAIAAVPTDGTKTTITMIANEELASGVTIAAGKNIVLELNGHTLSESLSNSGTTALITNNGTLTIQDSTDVNKNGTGTGKITYVNGMPDTSAIPGYASNTIINQGTLTIESGLIENRTNGGYAAYTVDNITNGGLFTPVFTMNGGRLYNNYTDAVRMFLNSDSKLNKVVINGGVLDSDKASGRVIVVQDPNAKLNKGELVITGGTINGKINAWSAANAGGVEDRFSDSQYAEISISISGGKMGELSFTEMANETLRAEAVQVTGGKYKVSPSAYVTEGYAVLDNTDDDAATYPYKVGVAPVAQIGETKYTSLADAIAAVPTDGTATTITMIADYEVPMDHTDSSSGGYNVVNVAKDQNVILDLNGKTITGVIAYDAKNSAVITVSEYGTLTIRDTSAAQTGTITHVKYDDGVRVGNWAAQNWQTDILFNHGGTLTVEGGTIANTANGNICYAIDTSNNYRHNNATLTITGGTITSQYCEAIRMRLDQPVYGEDSSRNVINISGGTISGRGGIWAQVSSGTAPKGSLTISGGTITGGDWGTLTYYAGNGVSIDDFPASITGGKITGTVELPQVNYISGGKFSQEPEAARIAEGYEAVANTDDDAASYPFVVTEAIPAVAQIGNVKYATLEAALAAAQSGDTITLLADVSLTERLFINAGSTPAYAGSGNRYATTTDSKSITLNLNGHDITSSSNIALAGGSLNITGTGTITTTASGLAPIEIRGTGDLTSKRTLTIGENVVLTGAQYGLNVFGSNNSNKNVIDVTVNGTVNGTLFVLGNLTNTENEINIVVNGTIAAPANTNDAIVGIALNGNANVTVNTGATVSGESGIEVRRGALTVNGGTITATAAEYSSTANNSGSTTKGAAIAIYQYGTGLDVTINGGTLNGVKKIAVNGDMSGVNASALQTYTTDNTVIPAGYKWAATSGNMYTLTVITYVAQIGEVKYETLADAIAAAQSGNTITLLANIDLTATVNIEKSLTIDLNGKNITATNARALWVKSGEVAITGEGTISATKTANGSFASSSSVIRVGNSGTAKAKLTIGTGVTVSTDYCYGVTVFGTNDGGVELVVNGNVTVTGTAAAISGNGNSGNKGNVTINTSAVVTAAADAAIYHPQGDTLTINGGSITGPVAVYQKSGTMTINGGTFTATAEAADYTPKGDGLTPTGDAIVIDNCGYPGGAPSASIKNATIANGQKIGYYVKETSAEGTVLAGSAYTLNTNKDRAWTANTDSTYQYKIGEVTYVAQIGEVKYETLAEAIAAATDGDTITLLANVTQDEGILFNKADVSVKLDLNGKTLTVNNGSNVNNRAIKINNGTLEVYNGSIVAVGSGTTSSNGTGCYGAFRVEANGKLIARNLTLTNSRPWGLNVKVLGGEAELTNVTINSSYGGGIEVTEADLGTHSKAGKATLTNCTFTQEGYFDHCSTALSVSGGSELIVNSGSYTGEYALYVFSSGGKIKVNGGTFTGHKDNIAIIAAIDTTTYPQYEGGLEISGGSFSGSYNITSPAYMTITGGYFTANPTAYVADGYAAVTSDLAGYNYKVVPYVEQSTTTVESTTTTTDEQSGTTTTTTTTTNLATAENGDNTQYVIKVETTVTTTPEQGEGTSKTETVYQPVQTSVNTANDVNDVTLDGDNSNVGSASEAQVTAAINVVKSAVTAAQNATFTAALTATDEIKTEAKVLQTTAAANAIAKAAATVNSNDTASISKAKIELQTTLKSVAVTETSGDVKATKVTYDIKPVAVLYKVVNETETAIGRPVELDNADIKEGETFTFTIPVPANMTATTVKVSHIGTDGYSTEIGTYTVDGTGNNRYVTVTVDHFSEFELEEAEVSITGSCDLSATISLVDSIDINFYVKNLASGTNLSGYTVKYTFKGVETVVAGSDWIEAAPNTGVYKFTVASCAAKEINDTVTFEVLYEGETIKKIDSYSIRQYCVNKINANSNQKLVELCRAVLDYGAAAQNYFNYNKANLANAGGYGLASRETSVSEEFRILNPADKADDITKLSATLSTVSKTEINFYVTAASSIENVQVTLNNANVDDDDIESGYVEDTGIYKITVKGIAAANLKNVYVLTFNTSAGTTTVTYSALAYTYSKQNTETAGEISLAIYNYYLKAKAYFG